jgi:hypothetical protein
LDTSLSFNGSTNTLTCPNITGVITEATAITITDTSTTAGTYYPTFVNTAGTNKSVRLDTDLTYNPSTNTLTSVNFSGTASSSSTITTTSDNTSGTYYIPFTKTSAGTGRTLYVDDTNGPLTYNPNTGNISATSYTITGTPSIAGVASTFGQVGLVYIGAVQVAITGSASSQNLNFASLFNSTYKNYRITLTPTTQLSFSSQYPSYSLAGFLGTGVPTTAGLFGYEMTSNSTALVSPVYTAFGTTLSTTPLMFAVSSFVNKQIQFDILNVGYAMTTTHSVQLNCKSVYSNPGIQGVSDRTISASALTGTTITGLIIQQTNIGAGNNMTLEATIYGYNTI